MSQKQRTLSTRWRNDLELIAKAHGFTLKRLQGSQRTPDRVRARTDCYRYLDQHGWSSPEIGGLFNRDHTTVLYALDRHGKTEVMRERARARYVPRPRHLYSLTGSASL